MLEYKVFLYPKNYPKHKIKIPSPVFFDLGIRNSLDLTYYKAIIHPKLKKPYGSKKTWPSNYENLLDEQLYSERIVWSDTTDSCFEKDDTTPFWDRTNSRSLDWELRPKRSTIHIRERDWEITIEFYKPTEKERLEELQTFCKKKLSSHPYQITILKPQPNSDLLTEVIYYDESQLPEDALEGNKIFLLAIECTVKKRYTFEWIKSFKEASLIELYDDIFKNHWFNITRPITTSAFENTKSYLFSVLTFLKDYQNVSVYLVVWVIFQIEWTTINWASMLNQIKLICAYIYEGLYLIIWLFFVYLSLTYSYRWLKEIWRLILNYPFLIPVFAVLLNVRFF